ncbi:Magnesium and cobalt efflux protein CorC [hydrothermal vent metagenome]|uniref:Magnesium and cobalt efflux protein CorC n=1 Tax=hydrothermal vent metagenome TaxID=652676 RepID=A0A3B0RWB0_9ZZZZ
MNDSIEGSSNAARGAQGNEQGDEEQGGLFRRMLAALTPGENATDEAGDAARPAGNNALGLGNLRAMAVEDVATPKADIISVPLTITKDELVKVFRGSGRTRLPVYKDTLDSPVGLAHLKDFALKHGFNGGGGRFSLKNILRPLLFVPPSMPIGVLLQKMQAERQHMALVIDEYGGVDGLVTIEDLIEQVVGEISDEHDIDEGHYWTLESPGVYLAQARAPLDEFEAEIGLSLTDAEDVDEEEVDTLGGVVFMLLGRVPVRGEVVEHPAGVSIEVIDADARRIKRLKVRLPGATD